MVKVFDRKKTHRTMAELISLGIIIGALLLGLEFVKILNSKDAKSKKNKPENYHYQQCNSLLTNTELQFYQVLRGVVKKDQDIMVKVRLADLISVAKDLKGKDWGTAFNRIKSKHVDFLICDSTKLKPILAIELDDRSHEKESRKARDAFLDQALESASVPLLRVKVASSYDTDKLREDMIQAWRLPIASRETSSV